MVPVSWQQKKMTFTKQVLPNVWEMMHFNDYFITDAVSNALEHIILF